MPCESPYSAADHAHDLKRELDVVTRLLCLTLGAIGDEMRASLFAKSIELDQWYARHLREDLERKSRERAEEARRDLRAQALAKLTPEERKVLHL